MGLFERYLSLWVGICILVGVGLGHVAPNFVSAVSRLEFANVNIVVAVLIWVMIYPMMIQVDFSSLKHVGRKPKGLAVTLVTNWLIKPFTMAALGMVFFNVIFANFVSPEAAKEYIAGMILLGVAPCTAMVFVWSHLTRGDPNYTLVQVSINDLIMVAAFAPIAAVLLGMNEILVPWNTLILSVFLYVVIPLVAGYLTRKALTAKNNSALDRFAIRLKPAAIVGLLLTVILLFSFQAEILLSEPMVVVLIAIPLLIQSYGIFAFAYLWSYKWRIPHDVAAPAALIGTSNFFEFAVATAIGMFGLESGAALATVVGVLIEVPVMLSLVAFANSTRINFDKRTAV